MSNASAPEPRQVLNQFVIAVLGLVVGSALLFFAIGTVGASPDEDAEPVAIATSSPTTAPTTPSAPTTSAPATQAPAEVVTPPAATTPAQVVTPDATEAPATPTEAPATPTEAPTTPSSGIDPASISVQVLDAKLDGSTTAAEVADQMIADGYDMVAEGRAGTVYQQTTIFYGDGQEAAAQQVADQYGWSAIRPNDVGLSDQVDLSILVGLSD
ncbi:MAG TPA: LytR C-terminal domain-containing protein [Nitriliruptoraceae bacterium]|nr:LytR C-terminal domain-containing protein [Nitriliruptoraceae bacterium]